MSFHSNYKLFLRRGRPLDHPQDRVVQLSIRNEREELDAQRTKIEVVVGGNNHGNNHENTPI